MADLDAIKNRWSNRFRHANKVYKEWENTFSCQKLYQAYEGKQWDNIPDPNNPPYTVNLIYTTIEIKNAFLLLAKPKFLLTPVAANSDWEQEFAFLATQLKQDMLNSLISNNRQHFNEIISHTVLDSYFRFGVAEVGYAADWMQNPLAPLPEKHPDENEPGVKITKQSFEEIPENEKVYFKHIPAHRFRVGGLDTTYLHRCNWYGYYEYHYRDDLESIKGIKFPDAADTVSVSVDPEDVDDQLDDAVKQDYAADMLKIWHIWDVRAKQRRILLDTGEELWSKDFYRSNVFDLRWTPRKQGFYPIPPVSQWISPQREYNESREQLRNFRRRFTRKYQVTGDIEEEELNKLLSGEDGACIRVDRENAVSPIDNPEIGAAVPNSLSVSKDEFDTVAGTSSAQRLVADRQTATQAEIINEKATVRESAEDTKLNRFIEAMGREAILTVQERFTEGFWIQQTADIAPPNQIFSEVQAMSEVYRYVSAEEISVIMNYDFKVDVDVVSMSSARNNEEKQKMAEFFAFVHNYPEVALSAPLIREVAYRCGYRNEKIIREMQQMATLAMLGQMNQQAGQVAQNEVQEQTPPMLENTRQQFNATT